MRECRAAQLEIELGAKEAQRAALLAEVALLRSQAAKAELRIGVLECEVVALTAQAEQSSYEHELAQKVQHPIMSASHTCHKVSSHAKQRWAYGAMQEPAGTPPQWFETNR